MDAIQFADYLKKLASQLENFAKEGSHFSEEDFKETLTESALVLSGISQINRIDGYTSAETFIPISKAKKMRALYTKVIENITHTPLLSFLNVTMIRYQADEMGELVKLAGPSGKIRVYPGLVGNDTDGYKMSFILAAEDATGKHKEGPPSTDPHEPDQKSGTVLDDGKPCPPDCPNDDF